MNADESLPAYAFVVRVASEGVEELLLRHRDTEAGRKMKDSDFPSCPNYGEQLHGWEQCLRSGTVPRCGWHPRSTHPGAGNTVTRLEAQAERGPAKYDATSGTNIACTKGIGFKITDRKSTYTLTVPSAAMMKTGANNPSSADSGPIRLRFPRVPR